MIHHANPRTVIVLDEGEREKVEHALSEVVKMLDEVLSKVDDPSSPDHFDIWQHTVALRLLLRAVEA